MSSSLKILLFFSIFSCSQNPTAKYQNQTRELSSVYSETAQAILKSNMKKFRRCHPKKSKTRETYTLNMKINADGDVQALNTTGKSLKVSKCLSLIARDIRFPNSPYMGKTEISQPLNF